MDAKRWPRLAAAVASWRREQRAIQVLRRAARARVLHLEALHAHRELQLCRAQTRRSLTYIAERQRKLAEVDRELATAELILRRLTDLWA
jgi:hypothetical protein